MAHNNNEENQEYQGVSKPAAAFGQSTVTGTKAGVIGGALGAAAGALLHKEVTQVVEETAESAAKTGRMAGLINEWNTLGRGWKAAVAAGAAATVAGAVGSLVGAVKGVRKTQAAREQFDQLTSDNKELNDKLAASEKSLSDVKSTMAIMSQSSEKSHVAELENRRAKSASREAGIA